MTTLAIISAVCAFLVGGLALLVKAGITGVGLGAGFHAAGHLIEAGREKVILTKDNWRHNGNPVQRAMLLITEEAQQWDKEKADAIEAAEKAKARAAVKARRLRQQKREAAASPA